MCTVKESETDCIERDKSTMYTDKGGDTDLADVVVRARLELLVDAVLAVLGKGVELFLQTLLQDAIILRLSTEQ